MVKSRRLIVEMIGATNWWLDKNGTAYMVYGGHGEFAQKQTGIKFLQHGPDDRQGWAAQGKAYETMYRAGWVRVSFKAPERRMQIEFRRAISRPAMEWLQDQAFERQAAVVDDTGRVYADFRPEDEQGGTTYRYRRYTSERIVEMLLNEIDAKELALRTTAHNYDHTCVWIATSGDEVPVSFNSDGFVFADAAYGLAETVPTEEYEAVTGQIIDELNAGKETGVAHGHRWVLRPHSIYEPPPSAASEQSYP